MLPPLAIVIGKGWNRLRPKRQDCGYKQENKFLLWDGCIQPEREGEKLKHAAGAQRRVYAPLCEKD